MKTTVILFPFDLFGSGGTGEGVNLLGEGLREILADNRREKVPTRADAYAGQVRIREFTFACLEDYTTWRKQARKTVRKVRRQGDFLVWITGNHLGALPVYDELAGQETTLVIQLDAHLDVQHFHDQSSEPSHANFLLHCAGNLPPLINLGNRDLLLPHEHIQQSYRKTFSAADLARDTQAVLRHLKQANQKAKDIFIDLDCDVFDPTFFPAVSRPVPFGLSPQQVLQLLETIWSERVRGIMISEFDPGRDTNDRCLATLLWLLEYLFGKR